MRVKLVEDEEGRNLVDVVWGDDKPAEPRTPVRPLGIAFSGETSSRKLSQLRAAMQKKDVQVAVVSALDEVAWLLNLRGADIDYNPLFMSFVVVTSAGDATLCAEPAQLASDETMAHLEKAGVRVKPYGSVGDVLQEIEGAARVRNETEEERDNDKGKVRVWLDPSTCNWDVFRTVQRLGMVPVRDAPLSVQLAKSLKNPTELDGMRACHIRDGAALCSHFAWLEAQLLRRANGESGSDGPLTLDEVTVADHLEARRAKEKHFVGLFETISSSRQTGCGYPLRASARNVSCCHSGRVVSL